jgi:hypothetical protein
VSVCPRLRSESIEYEVYPGGANIPAELAYRLYGAGRALFQRKLAEGDLAFAGALEARLWRVSHCEAHRIFTAPVVWR